MKPQRAQCLAFVAFVTFFAAGTSVAYAQPKAFLQWANAQGLDNKLALSRVPVRGPGGVIKYYDVSMAFTVDSKGIPKLNPKAVRITPSPVLAVDAFKPGTYKFAGTECEYVVGGPGPGPGGRTSWSITGSATCHSTYHFNAGWTTGQIAGHPNSTTLDNAGITFEGYAWGAVGDHGGFDYQLDDGDLIGAAQSGNNLILHNFGADDGEDSALVFTLCPSCS